jgi:arylsulfatase A-like enzyme
MTFRMIDLMPTVLGAADIEIPGGPAEMEGQDLWPDIVRGVDTGQAKVVFAEVSHADGYAARALIRDGKKIIHSKYRGTGRVMLFDLENDPEETVDLSESLPALRNDMLKDLGVTLETAASKKKETLSRVMDERLKARLRALGYID